MTMGEEFGQHFTYLFARLGAAGETPEAEGRETGRAIWCTGTGVTLRLAANRDQLVRQVAGEAVIEVGHQGRFIGALRLGGEGTEPVRHAVYHSRAWPGEALRPEAGECLVKRVKQTTDLMAVALRTGYVGEQSAERRVNCTKSVSVVILGLGEQGTFFALTLPVLPPDLTADVLVDRGVEAVECGGYDGNFFLFPHVLEAVKMSVHVFHEALVAHEEIPVYLAGQPLQRVGHLGGEAFKGCSRGVHVVRARCLDQSLLGFFNLIVDVFVDTAYDLCFGLWLQQSEEIVAHVYGLLEVADAEGVNLCLDFCEVFVDVCSIESVQLPTGVRPCILNFLTQLHKMLSHLRDCASVKGVNFLFNTFKACIFSVADLLYHFLQIVHHAFFGCPTRSIVCFKESFSEVVKLRGDLLDAKKYFTRLSLQNIFLTF
ncbi:Aspartate tyrosine aromatic aminotransferase, putative [Babesia ovata]|uniref:Aspartate tyrosine aromatic aminotransferase, putative n=1 Tax=Babesia ovata TaxID=189622 RepID=A0A2H6KJ23_9APIC|nr:Aspartate tyrosine aromatic aminotransferase, putative [Babesia ovata]GBE62997.1 Aspartate tyrosine aromatic aminotransferase, putative [Babesia ovata]